MPDGLEPCFRFPDGTSLGYLQTLDKTAMPKIAQLDRDHVDYLAASLNKVLRVKLPVRARVRRGRAMAYALYALVLGSGLGAMFVSMARIIAKQPSASPPAAVLLIQVAILAGLAVMSVMFIGQGLNGLIETVRAPALVVTRYGIEDGRSGRIVTWSRLRAAYLISGIRGAVIGVDLRLSAPSGDGRRRWQNPFRRGCFFRSWFPDDDRLVLSITHYDRDAYDLAQIILTLTQRCGAAISLQGRWGCHAGLKFSFGEP